MFGFTAPAGTDSADPLVNVAAVDDFWRLLTRFDPIHAQKKVSNALADFGLGDDPNVERLRALLLLDRRARNLADALLVNYTGRLAQSQSIERRYWQGARELAQGFGRAYGQILRQLEHDVLPRAARDFTPLFLLRLFQHRQVEFLLQPFENGQPDPGTWSELHEAYQYAHSQRLLDVRQEIRRSHEMATVETTIEREYLHLLLLDMMNGGYFSPYDAFWANQWIPGGCEELTLKSVRAPATGDRMADHFVVDLDSSEGLVRVAAPGAVRCLFLDPTPLLERIDVDIAARRDGTHNEGGPPTTVGRGGRLKVLRKLRSVYSPKPPRVNRRGERKPVAVVVQAIVGLSNIARMLRNEQRRTALLDPSVTPEVEEITITVKGAIVESTTVTGADGELTISVPSAPVPVVPRLMWEIRDRSESGCRLHGKAASMNGVIPGTLIAMREHEMAPWTLVIVRRRGKAIADHLDIGVEFIGKEPRRVVATLIDDTAPLDEAAGARKRRFAVLFLPESSRQPVLPFKTLIVPAGEFEENRSLTLRAGGARHTLRLKQPIEEQGEFSWLPFEVVERHVLERAA